MTLRHLMIFVSVVDNKSMNKAAQTLHISQPSISQAIAELEHHYGVKLFERLSQRLYITKEGELLLSFSRHILDSYKQMEEAMNHAIVKTKIIIGCSVSIGTCLINDILDKAQQQLPDCQFQVIVNNSSDIQAALLKNQIDIGIVEGIVNDENLISMAAGEDELVFVCGKTHPLSAHQILHLNDLQNQNYVSRESGSTEKNQYEQLLEQNHIQLNRIFCSTNTEAIKNAVIHGRGLAIFSRRMVKEEVQNKELIILDIQDIHVKRNYHLIKHKNKFMSKSLQTLQEICIEYLKEAN